MFQRIAKAISSAGYCSRRQAELLIEKGVVKVNDITIASPITFVDDDSVISIDNIVINRINKTRIWVYYKPNSLITTHNDPEGRKTVFESLVGLPRVISIGRLDINSEGLLLLTNNGELARKLELPSSKIERVYKVRAYGNPHIFKSLSLPINIEGVLYRPKSIKLLNKLSTNSWFEVVLTEGKNREIRKIFEYYGLKVNKLIRIRYGSFILGDLKPNEYREELVPSNLL